MDGAFVPGDLMAADLGSREKIASAKALVWYPSEMDVSIRPGWFYHADQDDHVKTPEKLVDIYYSSVGRNSVLLLNLPPDTRGLIHDNDIRSLMGMRTILDRTFATNLVAGATARASNQRPGHTGRVRGGHRQRHVLDDGRGGRIGDPGVRSPVGATFDRAMLQEYIRVGQRVERFHLDAWNGSAWTRAAEGTTIGYKRLLRFPSVTASKIRLVIDESRTSPTLSTFGLYKAPPRVTVEPDGGAFEDSVAVRLSSDVGGVTIYYTLDGTTPTLQSARYAAPIVLTRSATVTALAAVDGELGIEASEARFLRCKRCRGSRSRSATAPNTRVMATRR